MNIFKIITCVFLSCFFAFTNSGFSQCQVTISNTQCRIIGVYNEANNLLTTMSRGPMPNSPMGTPTPTWTDPILLGDDETRTYFLKEGNFVLTTKTVTCENNEINTSNPYADACQDGVRNSDYTNIGCRPLTMVSTNGFVLTTIAPDETHRRQSTNFIYIFLVDNDTIDIKSDEGGEIDSGGCEELNPCKIDSLPPICMAPADLMMTCDSLNLFLEDDGYESDSIKRIAYFGAATSMDNCNAEVVELSPLFNSASCFLEPWIRRFIAIDENGNQSKDTCFQIISPDRANTEFFIQMPDLNQPYEPRPTDVIYTNKGCHSHITFGETVYGKNNLGDTTDIITNFMVLNWCIPQESYNIPPLDLNNDGIFGDAFFLRGKGDSVYIPQANMPDLVLPFGVLFYNLNKTKTYRIEGKIFLDTDEDCEKDIDENGLQFFTIKVRALPSGIERIVKSRNAGDYDVPLEVLKTDSLLEVSIESSLNLGKFCNQSYVIPLESAPEEITQDFPVQLKEECPVLTIDVGTPRLRRCFTNTYTVNYCNYGLVPIKEAEVQLTLDPFLLFKNSSIDISSVTNNLYAFKIDSIGPTECGQFTFEVEVNCDAALGQTHCVEAHIFPNTLCEPIDPAWNDASVAVEGFCDQDSVRFLIKNIGDGDMTKENSFVVTEDVLMLKRGVFQLDAGKSIDLVFPAIGATYHLITDQIEGHPGRSQPTTFVEGCGGINTTGLVNALPMDDLNPFIAKDCQENIGSYDPNDKGATPSGRDSQHYLAKNTDIDYKIRFQNTGTDTAFTVVIVDTLSTFLDANTILPGAASHTYTYQQHSDTSSGLTIIQFTFNDILLPDSTTNLEGSNGFVKFKIAQQPDLVDGTILENKAAIFFDFNEPIITNTVFHTIGEPFGRIISNTKNVLLSNREIIIQPNPFSESTQLSISGNLIKKGTLRLFNSLGQAVQQQSFSGNQITLQGNNLPSGFYIYSIVVDNQLIATGKIQVSKE